MTSGVHQFVRWPSQNITASQTADGRKNALLAVPTRGSSVELLEDEDLPAHQYNVMLLYADMIPLPRHLCAKFSEPAVVPTWMHGRTGGILKIKSAYVTGNSVLGPCPVPCRLLPFSASSGCCCYGVRMLREDRCIICPLEKTPKYQKEINYPPSTRQCLGWSRSSK
jgi:hypothetical protein